MKPSEQWQAINEKQFWKAIPKDYKIHYGKPLTAKHLAKTVHLNLTDKQFTWLQTFRRNYRNFYGSDDNVVESLLVNMINNPLENYIDPTTNRWSRVHNTREAESHHTYVISEEVLKKVGEITLDGRVISAQTQLKIIIQNSKQLHDNGWFYDLTKRKTKNPTRKEVI
ncbi:hypothetical protein ABQE17_15795 [Enterococcus gallinarum]|uniref:hypothetical protein n=1 Tax=Enterococcus gallinarum TaxID=1353 RepID=UPI0032E3B61B